MGLFLLSNQNTNNNHNQNSFINPQRKLFFFLFPQLLFKSQLKTIKQIENMKIKY